MAGRRLARQEPECEDRGNPRAVRAMQVDAGGTGSDRCEPAYRGLSRSEVARGISLAHPCLRGGRAAPAGASAPPAPLLGTAVRPRHVHTLAALVLAHNIPDWWPRLSRSSAGFCWCAGRGRRRISSTWRARPLLTGCSNTNHAERGGSRCQTTKIVTPTRRDLLTAAGAAASLPLLGRRARAADADPDRLGRAAVAARRLRRRHQHEERRRDRRRRDQRPGRHARPAGRDHLRRHARHAGGGPHRGRAPGPAEQGRRGVRRVPQPGRARRRWRSTTNTASRSWRATCGPTRSPPRAIPRCSATRPRCR